jgi:DNA-binding PadR family transcriptional regulator
VRVLLLGALADGDAHGYELIRRLEERSAGTWRPSAGSVYPTLQLLEDAGLIVGRDEGGKRVVALTDEGRAEAARTAGQDAWSSVEAGGNRQDLRAAVVQLGSAARQVAIAGDTGQIEAAGAILVEARQKLYRLLAGD